MPPNVAADTPTTVMPFALCKAFSQTRTHVVWTNLYSDGNATRRLLTATSRRSWKLTERLTGTQLDDLLSFRAALHNGLDAFWFYDLFETSPRFSYDPTGAATLGRYPARFSGALDQTFYLGRSEAQFTITEVATS